MTDLNNALVLITGASGGFGRQMTAQFLQCGCNLIVSDRDEGSLHTLKAEFSAQADRIRGAIPADLSTRSGCQDLFDGVEALGLSPDILVNNAGIAFGGRFDHVPQERWEELMQINLLAPMRLCAMFMPQMIARRSGHIVNIASLAGWVGSPGMSAYCASKFGLHGFSESLAAELEECNVRVSGVYPCFSRTPILDSEQFGYAERRKVPEEMISEPADVVAAIIKGVKRNRLHIFPDKMARRIHYLKRFFPGLLPRLNKRMQEQSIRPE